MSVSRNIALGVGLGALGAAAIALQALRDERPKRRKTSTWEAPRLGVARAIAVGDPRDPEIDALLREMADEFRSYGADPTQFSPREMTRMASAPGMPSAIPERWAWKNMAEVVRNLLMPARRAIGPLTVNSGYRPEDYNAAIGGSDKSRHLSGSGADVSTVNDADMPNLARYFARRYAAGAPIGLGIYGTRDISHIHVDLGPRRKFEDTDYWLSQIGVA